MKTAVLVSAERFSAQTARAILALSQNGAATAVILPSGASDLDVGQWKNAGVSVYRCQTDRRGRSVWNASVCSAISDFADADVVAVSDGGNVPTPEVVSAIADAVRGGKCPAVGVRFSRERGRTAGFWDRISSLVFRVASGRFLPDTGSGLFAFPADRADELTAEPVLFGRAALSLALRASECKTDIKPCYIGDGGGDGKTPFAHRAKKRIGEWWFLYLRSAGLKYLTSSVIAFLADYALTLFLAQTLGWTAEIAFVCAWTVSSLCNFALNYLFAFRSRKRLWVALGEYYTLAAAVFAIKRMVIQELLFRLAGVPLALASPAAEILMYPVTYLIQKTFVFRKQK